MATVVSGYGKIGEERWKRRKGRESHTSPMSIKTERFAVSPMKVPRELTTEKKMSS